MKKLIIILFFTASSQTNAQTSVYHVFPDSGAVWNVHYFVTCSATVFEYHDYSYIMTGDTTIGNFVYHKLAIPAELIAGQCGHNGVRPLRYSGAFREDAGAKKVYYVPALD